MQTSDNKKYYVVALSISSIEYAKLYRGQASDVLARSETGEKLRFPARSLQPFLLNDGIRGRFAIVTDQQNKLIKIERLG